MSPKTEIGIQKGSKRLPAAQLFSVLAERLAQPLTLAFAPLALLPPPPLTLELVPLAALPLPPLTLAPGKPLTALPVPPLTLPLGTVTALFQPASSPPKDA